MSLNLTQQGLVPGGVCNPAVLRESEIKLEITALGCRGR